MKNKKLWDKAGEKKMKKIMPVVLMIVSLFVFATSMYSKQKVRVATYNIKFLSDRLGKLREQNLEDVIEKLKANIIGLQEIKNRKALEQIFPVEEWDIIIDDNSLDNQDLALVVKKPLKVLGFK